jgi:hypothetical protein
MPPIQTSVRNLGACADSEHPVSLNGKYRLANSSVCRRGNTEYAAASMKAKVTKANALKLAGGGYNDIERESGAVDLVGFFVSVVSRMQHKSGVFGTVGELGVHHGRFTSTLFITARKPEKLVVADVFEQQDKNVDGSGKGSKERFFDSLSIYGLDQYDLFHVHTGSTDEIPFNWAEVVRFEPFRLLSVDAGHTAPLTYNDLELGFCNSLTGSIIILDDLFHPHWAGVTEGLFKFMTYTQTSISVYPFLHCDGKLFMTNDLSFHGKYYSELLSDPPSSSLLVQNASMWGGSQTFRFNGVPYLACYRNPGVNVTAVWLESVY